MAARPIWRGQIRLALVSIPVEIYPATKSGATVSFRQIHEPSGKPIHYEKDRRTCVLKVKLEPGKTYAIWLNSDKFTNFKDADGRPAVPYLLVFQTKNPD